MLQDKNTRLKPPRIIQTLVQGFNLIAAHPYLMLFPLLLDLFFWFGPFFRIKELLTPFLEEMLQSYSTTLVNNDVLPSVEVFREVWSQLLANFNLLTGVRTYPIGVPSLLSLKGYTPNPVGFPLLIEVNSSAAALRVLFISAVIGILLGSIYYALISRLINKGKEEEKGNLFYLIGQSFSLFIMILILLAILSFPVLCFISSISAFIPTMGMLPLIVLGIIVLWFCLPLVFSPHGIFTRNLSAIRSISLSTKFVRLSSFATSFFLTIAVSLSYGMDLLWSTPKPDSWLFLLGLFGHAFISSGILCASFIYFRDGTRWMEEVIKLSPQNVNGLKM